MGASRRHRSCLLVAVLLATLPLAACGGAPEEVVSRAMAASEEITFTTPDGVRLAGRLFNGPTGTDANARSGLVLAHMLPADQSSWYAEAVRYAGAGYAVLTFDLRGYCPGGDAGCSEGERSPDAAAVDLAAAVARLREAGVREVGIIGASIGGTAALVVAADDPGIASVITLSAPRTVGGLAAAPDVVARITAAKLFLAGVGDGAAADDAEAFYNDAGQPKRFEVLTSDDHGTDLLTGGAGGRVHDFIDGWLAAYLPVDGSASP